MANDECLLSDNFTLTVANLRFLRKLYRYLMRFYRTQVGLPALDQAWMTQSDFKSAVEAEC